MIVFPSYAISKSRKVRKISQTQKEKYEEIFNPKKLYETGVSTSLSTLRKKSITDLQYNLSFFIPKDKKAPIEGTSVIIFNLNKKSYRVNLAIDFKADNNGRIESIDVNGKKTAVDFHDEHLIIDKSTLKEGINRIFIKFNTNSGSLNRRDDLLYTLLVPDRARTLFPCFEQPDLKAKYTLKLSLPKDWEAISNSNVCSQSSGIAKEFEINKMSGYLEDDYKTIDFYPTEPLSTYLFSFVAGKFYKSVQMKNDSCLSSVKTINIFHRSSDERELKQIPAIADEVFASLKWMEEYTGVDYAFSKYDLILIPGFQYGGMEHTGATLYNDSQLFLPDNPTIEQKIRRTQLIAHETAHMWFGDLVTMNDFSEVWVKEVFANFFANMMVRPSHPEINYTLNDLDFYRSSYSEDRTRGANPIEQKLDNIKYAGLIYGNIIYNKSPIAMGVLYDLIGDKAFKSALHNYMVKFKYSNASWSDIVKLIKKESPGKEKIIDRWNAKWILKAGMPKAVVNNSLTNSSNTVVMYDKGYLQKLKIGTININNRKYIIPNSDAKFYGSIALDSCTISIISGNLYSGQKPFDAPETRMAMLMTLYENYLNNVIDPVYFTQRISGYLNKENNIQIFPELLSYLSSVAKRDGDIVLYGQETLYEYIENSLAKYLSSCNNKQFANYAFRTFYPLCKQRDNIDTIFSIWKNRKSDFSIDPNDDDYIGMTYELGIKVTSLGYRPDGFGNNADSIINNIINYQLGRIKNRDKASEFKFVSKAIAANTNDLDSLFNNLLMPEYRKPEPWATKALSLLNHPFREKESIKYILPALEKLEEVQKTGDIFMPKNWVSALLSGHHSSEAADIVDKFLLKSKMPMLLRNKVLFVRYYMDKAH